MKKLFNFIRVGWIKAQLKAPPGVQRTLLPSLHDTKEVARLFLKPYLPMRQWQGQGQGGPLTVTYIGPGYSKLFLKRILFAETPVDQPAGQIPVWRCGQLTEMISSDIIIVEASKRLVRYLPDQNAIIFPENVDHCVDTRGEWPDIQSRFHKTVRKNELRLMRKYGYEYDLSYNEGDFEKFYHQMYLLTTGERHNERSTPFSVEQAYQIFKNGCLFRVKREGEWVSGVICHPEGDILIADISGVKDGNTQLIHEGATAATYYFTIKWANEHGYAGVNYLGSRPYLKTGLFQHKRKWGSTVSLSPYLQRLIWLRVQRMTGAVNQFLKDTPLVTVDKAGQLYGLIVVDDPHNTPAEVKQDWEKHYATAGLNSFLVRPVSSFAEEQAQIKSSDLVIPMSLTSSVEN